MKLITKSTLAGIVLAAGISCSPAVNIVPAAGTSGSPAVDIVPVAEISSPPIVENPIICDTSEDNLTAIEYFETPETLSPGICSIYAECKEEDGWFVIRASCHNNETTNYSGATLRTGQQIIMSRDNTNEDQFKTYINPLFQRLKLKRQSE